MAPSLHSTAATKIPVKSVDNFTMSDMSACSRVAWLGKQSACLRLVGGFRNADNKNQSQASLMFV